MAAAKGKESLLEALGRVPDPRGRQGRRYPAASMLALAVCAMACGARSLYAICQWGKEHQHLVCEALGIKRRRTPGGVTLHRLFVRLDTEAFEAVLGTRLSDRGLKRGQGIALDVQDATGYSRGRDSGSTFGVGLCAPEWDRIGPARGAGQRAGVGGGPGRAEEPGPEGTDCHRRRSAGPERHLRGHRRKRGHYLFRLKGNQPGLHEGVKLLFEHPVSAPVTVRQQNRHGDRLEVRELALSAELDEWAQWPGLAQVGRLTYLRRRKGQTTTQTSYTITSLSAQQATPAQLLHLVRGQRGIENKLHWVREVTFDEDRCQIRTGAAPQVMAALRNTVIGLLRLRGVRNIAAALRSHAWQAQRAIALVTTSEGITQ